MSDASLNSQKQSVVPPNRAARQVASNSHAQKVALGMSLTDATALKPMSAVEKGVQPGSTLKRPSRFRLVAGHSRRGADIQRIYLGGAPRPERMVVRMICGRSTLARRNPAEAGCRLVDPNSYARLRRLKPRPTSPIAVRARVAGSGTVERNPRISPPPKVLV